MALSVIHSAILIVLLRVNIFFFIHYLKERTVSFPPLYIMLAVMFSCVFLMSLQNFPSISGVKRDLFSGSQLDFVKYSFLHLLRWSYGFLK